MEVNMMKRLNRALVALAIFTAILFALSGCKNNTEAVKVKMVVQDFGTIYLELDPAQAPITVANFVKLVDEGFYNGLTFHRVIDGFMIQGGDPMHNGMGGSEENIKGEFDINGVKNGISHLRGAISMGRTMYDYDSASSQFFIVHQDSPHLDGQYAAFGRVYEGMEVVDAICQNTPVTDNNGTVQLENQPVITSVEIIGE